LTSDLENLNSIVHSDDEYLCQLSFIKIPPLTIVRRYRVSWNRY